MTEDKLKILSGRLDNIIQGIQRIEKLGMDEEILICWLCQKTKLSKANVKIMLKSQEEFYDKMVCSQVVNNL